MSTAPTHIGRYELVSTLGEGGMAQVFLAREHGPRGFRRVVVIKRIKPELAHLPDFVNMFLDEAQAVAALNHPNIVRIIELRDDDGLYMVMEYLSGENLSSLRRRYHAKTKSGLNSGLIAHIIAEIAGALEAAHTLRDDGDDAPRPIVHRDVAPGNIIVTYDGQVKLLDFGIAWMVDRTASTEAGQIKGKYPYMSPEQAQGMAIDARSDLFSLGIVAYEMAIAGRLFKRSSTYSTLHAVCEAPIAPPSMLAPDLAPGLERLILRALQRDLTTRYPTARAMRQDALAVRDELLRQDPAEALSAVMSSHFADRIESRRRLLSTVDAGRSLSDTLMNDLHAANTRTVQESPLAEAPPGFMDRVLNRRTLPWWAAVTFVGAFALGAHLVRLANPSPESGPKPTQITAVTPPAAAKKSRVIRAVDNRSSAKPSESTARLTGRPKPAATPPHSDTPSTSPDPFKKARVRTRAQDVRVEVETEPEGARIWIDGKAMGITPQVLKLPAGDEPVTLKVRRTGHRTLTRTIVPSKDRALRLQLSPSKTKRPSGKKKSSESFEYERFD